MCKHIYKSDYKYPKGTPFTYLISWTDLDIHYYGVRYSKTCHPNDLWNTYFTSSKHVKKFRKENGEPDIVKIDYIFDLGDEARKYEEYFIIENNCVYDQKWLNRCKSGKDYCCVGHSDETRKKMSDSKKGSRTINNGILQKQIRPELLQEYLEQGWEFGILEINRIKQSECHKGKIISEEQKRNQSIAMKGRPKSEETKRRMSEGMKGKIISEEHKKNLSIALRGKRRKSRKPLSDELKEKISNSLKGKFFINNGIEQKHVNQEIAETLYIEGWIKGKLPK